MPGPASRASVVRLLNLTHNAGCRGCGGNHNHHHHHPVAHSPAQLGGMRGMATPVDVPFTGQPPPGKGDFAFEVSQSLDTYHSRTLIVRWHRRLFASDREQLQK